MPAAKPLAPRLVRHIIERRSQRPPSSFTQIAAELSIMRGAASAFGIEKRKRMVSSWTVRQYVLRWENGELGEYMETPQAEPSENIVASFDERHPEHQVESSEDRVANAPSMNAVPVKGERDPLGNEHHGKASP